MVQGFFKANRAATLSVSWGLGQTTCFHLLVYFSQEGDQNIFSHALLLLPIQTLYGKEEELETVPAQPPFSQPSRPTQWSTQHYKLRQLGASDYFYGNLLQVQKWINGNFSSWLHFENQNWLLEKLLDFPALPHQKTDYFIQWGWYNSTPNRFWAY